jgi:hypothetical protein
MAAGSIGNVLAREARSVWRGDGCCEFLSTPRRFPKEYPLTVNLRGPGAIAVLMLILGACSTGTEQTKEPALRVGSRAPDFELPDAQGGKVSLASFRGDRAALLYFSMGPG